MCMYTDRKKIREMCPSLIGVRYSIKCFRSSCVGGLKY